MKVALVSEGTYPFAMGGVSVWCDQLIRGLHDYEWEMIALTVDGSERSVWEAPDNLMGISTVPLWGPRPKGGRRWGQPSAELLEAYRCFVTAITRPVSREMSWKVSCPSTRRPVR